MMTSAPQSPGPSVTNQDYRVLLVDDEQSLLDGLVRHHRKSFNLTTACGGAEALELISKSEPFAVVVSDFRMPGMDGIQFLQNVHETSPDSIRVMLTGNSEYNIALRAVNQGNVFRFLAKPIHEDEFRSAITAAIAQYELRRAEKVLLEQTLKGTIGVLSEILALTNPFAFGRATRIKTLVSHVTQRLSGATDWQTEMAALLSQIGCVSIPATILESVAKGDKLDDAGAKMVARHPLVAQDLLGRIPRLEEVAQIVGSQNRPILDLENEGCDQATIERVRNLQAAIAVNDRLMAGSDLVGAITHLRKRRPELELCLDALSNADVGELALDSRKVHLDDITVGMVLDQDVVTENGAVLVPGGFSITAAVLERLRNHAQLSGLSQEFSIRIDAQ